MTHIHNERDIIHSVLNNTQNTLQRQRFLHTSGWDILTEMKRDSDIIHHVAADQFLRPNSTQCLQRSISADVATLARPRRNSRLFNRRQSHYEFDPRKLVEIKRKAGFWFDSQSPLGRLRFKDSDDEKAFCKLYREKGRKVLRLWSFFLIFAALLTANFVYSCEHSYRRLWIICSAFQIFINLTFLLLVNSNFWQKVRIQCMTSAVIFGNALVSTIFALTIQKFPNTAVSLTLISYAGIRLRLRYAIFVGFLILLSFNIIYLMLHTNWSALLYINVQFFASNLLGILTGYYLEKRERTHFFDLYTYYEDCSLVEFEKDNIDFLLKAAIPAKFIEKLPHSNPADKFPSVSVAFICIDNLIEYSQTSEESVQILNEFFRVCEARAQQFGCEKIKTIQDKFMVVCGAPEAESRHAEILADTVLAIVQDFKEIEETPEFRLKYPGLRPRVRVGMSSGPLVAGVIGVKRFCWDVWGDTVNVAARMEDPKNGMDRPHVIRISSSTRDLLRKTHKCIPSSSFYVKGKGEMQTYILDGRIQSRMRARRPSEPRDNQLPEFRAFSWDSLDDDIIRPAESTKVSDQTHEKFKHIHFAKTLPETRLVMVVVLVLYAIVQAMYLLLPVPLSKSIYIAAFSLVVPLWLFHLFLTYSPLYTQRTAVVLTGLSLLAMLCSTLYTQVCLAQAGHGMMNIFDATLSHFSWVSYLAHPLFSVFPSHHSILATLLIGATLTAISWIGLGATISVLSVAEIVYFVTHFFICTLFANIWVSHELNSMVVKSWQLECIIEERRKELVKKMKTVQFILLNIIPRQYLDCVYSQHQVNIDVRGIHNEHQNVTVLSSDVANFTSIADTMDPITLVSSLHELFCRFDALTEKYSLEKIKTIGDAYIACSGLFSQNNPSRFSKIDLHSAFEVRNAVEMALDMQEEVAAYNEQHPDRADINIRIGIHRGPVFSGIVGHSKFQFDIFGQTVGITDTIERTGRKWYVHITDEVKKQLDLVGLSTSCEIQVENGCGYTVGPNSEHRESYLLYRTRWLDKDGKFSGACKKVNSNHPDNVVSTLSILSQCVHGNNSSLKRQPSSSSLKDDLKRKKTWLAKVAKSNNIRNK